MSDSVRVFVWGGGKEGERERRKRRRRRKRRGITLDDEGGPRRQSTDGHAARASQALGKI